MLKEFYISKRWVLWSWGGLAILLVSIYAQVYMSVLYNVWYGKFYDILGQKNGDVVAFWHEFAYFLKVTAFYIPLVMWTNWFTRIFAFRWRKAMTFDYISKWRFVEEEIEGSSQRIQEDAYRFARIVESLGLQVVRAVMTLIAFLPILWTLSNGVIIRIVNWTVPCINSVEGNLVYVAILTTVIGLVVSWFVGYYLPELEYNNQKCEAAFRKELVLGEDDKEKYVVTKQLARLFFGLEHNYHRLFLHYGYFDLWYNIYDQLMVILPYVIIGPSVVTGVVTFGVLVQVSNAFGKVQSSMALFIQNWVTITELRSIWRRLHEFERNIKKYDTDIAASKDTEQELYDYKEDK